MANSNVKKIGPALFDELLKNQHPQTIFSSEGLLGDLKKALEERMLDAYVFESLRQVREITRNWITEYNEERPPAGRKRQKLYFRTVSFIGKITVAGYVPRAASAK